MRKVIYSIQGNIGSGKSTLLKSLMRSMPQIVAIPQPVENWQQVAGYNLLHKYYQDPQRWGYTFQINCILSRMNQLSKSISTMKSNNFYVSQRSVQADKFIFAKLIHKLKKINDMQYHLYLQMFESLQNLFNKHSFSSTQQRNMNEKFKFLNNISNRQQKLIKSGPLIYRHIYLKTSPQKCFQRIKKRSRPQEKSIEYSYIKQLDNLHEEWLVEGNRQHRQGKCLVLDGQRQFQTDKQYLSELIGQIKSYIYENSIQGEERWEERNNKRRQEQGIQRQIFKAKYWERNQDKKQE